MGQQEQCEFKSTKRPKVGYNYTMNLYILKYLSLLIQEGGKTNKELALIASDSVSHASHALNILYSMGMVVHPVGRKSWVPKTKEPLILTLEKLLLISKGNPEIKRLLFLSSGIYIGAEFHKKRKNITISFLVKLTGLSRKSVMKILKQMEESNLIRKEWPKPYRYYPLDTMLSQIFFESCKEITNLFLDKDKKILSHSEIIRRIKDEESVLILVQYGSSVRKETDSYSDIDLFVVTRDKMSRGEIISRYSHKKIDMGVYSKSGFLELIRRQPDFVSHLAMARVLKGDDILKEMI